MKTKFKGHDIKDWAHYKTPRTISGFYVDRGEKADRMVIRASLLIGAFLLLGTFLGVI